MQEKVISFETAKLAKEKGFDVPVIYGYNELGKIDDIVDTDYGKNFEYQYDNINSRIISEEDILFENWEEWINYSAPTQSLLQKWLRETHGINIFMSFKPNVKKWDFIPYFMSMNGKEYVKHNSEYLKLHRERKYDTYEEALEKGLQEALLLI